MVQPSKPYGIPYVLRNSGFANPSRLRFSRPQKIQVENSRGSPRELSISTITFMKDRRKLLGPRCCSCSGRSGRKAPYQRITRRKAHASLRCSVLLSCLSARCRFRFGHTFLHPVRCPARSYFAASRPSALPSGVSWCVTVPCGSGGR